MPKLEYFLVAESVSIDSDRNQVSVFNILEEVPVPKVSEPKVVPKLVALSSWIIAPEDKGKDFQVAVELVGPEPECPYNADFTVNFTANGSRQRTQIGLIGLPIERPGDTTFRLKLNGEHRASHVLSVLANYEHSD